MGLRGPIAGVAIALLGGLTTACTPGAGAGRTTSARTASAPTSITPNATTSTTATSTTTAPPAPPYPVATATVPLVDGSRPTVSHGHPVAQSRALTTIVWYPVINIRSPLVVFAPGFNVGPDTYRHLGQVWAAAGYVVAAPEFPLGDPEVAGASLDENDLQNEPGDIRFVLSSLVAATSPLADRIDTARVGLAGHSDGTEAVLEVAQQGDVAIRAVLAFSGQPVVPRGPASPPLLVAQGSADAINPPARSQAVYDQASRPRALLTLIGAGHLPPFAGGTRWQPVVDDTTVAFLDRYLAGQPVSGDAVVAAGRRPGLSSMQAQL